MLQIADDVETVRVRLLGVPLAAWDGGAIVRYAGRVYLLKMRDRKYTLEGLLAQCDLSLPMSQEEIDWMNDPPVGREEN